jgi:hypothetical protein
MQFMTPEEYAAGADPVASQAEAFEERAAMLEYEAGFDRETAEAKAEPMSTKWNHHMNLVHLRMQAMRLAKKRGKR